MLILIRNPGQSIIINGNIKVTILTNDYSKQVKVGIDAPDEVEILR